MKDDLDQLETLGQTAAYHTLFSIVADRKFAVPRARLPHPARANPLTAALDKESRPLMRPSEALGVFVDRLDRRFDDMDESIRGKLLDAMKWEDTKLGGFLNKSRLDEWYLATLEAAENTVAYRLRVGAAGDGTDGSSHSGHENENGNANLV